MKRLLCAILIFLQWSALTSAIPARRDAFLYRQPDGSVLELHRHGDEYCNWTTDASGKMVSQGSDGFYHSASQPKRLLRREAGFAPSVHRASANAFGSRNILCLLVEFSDSVFVIDDPKASFDAMLNQTGYSSNGATGSVRDYYLENSHGKFDPHFDVYGPVRLEESAGYYGKTDNGARALRDAALLLDDQIDFSDYDSDGDGAVDMILFYFAGHNQAEGAGEESIWPHQSYSYGIFDGVRLSKYFCTSELKGYRGAEMCGIGTTCHEFAHSLGLHDFYDTDYEKSGGENKDTPGYYMLMDYGGYLNDGRTPPYLSAIERNILGWMGDIPPMEEPGQYTILPVQEDDGRQHSALVEGERFVYEYRNGEGWDSYLPSTGMLVYHIDASQRIVGDDQTADYLWNNTNKFNCYGGHPCCRLIPSDGTKVTFPGSAGVTTYSPRDWDGNNTGHILKDIACTDGAITLTLERITTSRAIWGTVCTSGGEPVGGASVSISRTVYAPSGYPRPKLSTDIVATCSQEGEYMINVPDDWPDDIIIYVWADAFTPQGEHLTLYKPRNMDFTLTRIGEPDHDALSFYSADKTGYRISMGSVDAVAVAVMLDGQTARERGYEGGKLESMTLISCADTFEGIYAVVYKDSDPVFVKDITSSHVAYEDITVDLSEAGISIPEEGALYVGYAITGIESGTHPLFLSGPYESNDGGGYRAKYIPDSPLNWLNISSGGQYYYPYVTVKVSIPREIRVSDMGVSWLDGGDAAHVAGESFIPVLKVQAGRPVSSVSWFYDGSPAAGEAVTLSSGAHTWMAEILYCDGTREKVWYDFDVD